MGKKIDLISNLSPPPPPLPRVSLCFEYTSTETNLLLNATHYLSMNPLKFQISNNSQHMYVISKPKCPQF